MPAAANKHIFHHCTPSQQRAAGSGAEPQLTNDLVHFSLKIWHLVATRIKWANFVHFMIYSVQGWCIPC